MQFEVEGWSLPPIKERAQSGKTDNKARKNKKARKINDKEVQDLFQHYVEHKETGPSFNEKNQGLEKAGSQENDSIESDAEKKRKLEELDGAKQSSVKNRSDKSSTEKPKRNKESKSKEKTFGTIPSSTSTISLTPLQLKMKEKLAGSRFRWINEQLYTVSSGEAVKMIAEHPEMFDEYHSGFRSQVQGWPQNPVDQFVAEIKERLNKPIGAPGGLPGEKDGSIVIADMGCGDAQLALDITNMSKSPKTSKFMKKANFKVHSYDLKKTNERVQVADIKNVPLPDQSCHIIVFCLSLMGTNFLDFIKEALRILKPRGELWIAEIKSRFVDSDASEFVKILKGLGVLHKSTDDSSKMFIRMEFFKPPKEIKENRDHKSRKPKFIDEDETKDLESKRQKAPEGQWLLKPCIYKRR